MSCLSRLPSASPQLLQPKKDMNGANPKVRVLYSDAEKTESLTNPPALRCDDMQHASMLPSVQGTLRHKPHLLSTLKRPHTSSLALSILQAVTNMRALAFLCLVWLTAVAAWEPDYILRVSEQTIASDCQPRSSVVVNGEVHARGLCLCKAKSEPLADEQGPRPDH